MLTQTAYRILVLREAKLIRREGWSDSKRDAVEQAFMSVDPQGAADSLTGATDDEIDAVLSAWR